MRYTATEQQVLEITVPEKTRTYKPISNKELIDLSRENITKAGFSIQKEQYSIAREGTQANGRYIINGEDVEMALMIGWQNSYDKSLSLKFSLGSIIFICSNGCIATQNIGSFKKKHQGDVQEFTPARIGDFVKEAGETFYQLQQDRDRMKERQIDRKIRAELVGRMYIDEAIITSTQVGIIKKEIEAPTHDYSAPNSMWELYNYTTFAAKEEHPSNYFKTHADIHKFFKEQIN